MSLILDTAAQDLLFREARTANTFTDEPVTEEQAKAIYDLVKYGPTAMNTQPLRITFVRSPEARERLVSHMSEGNKAKTASAPLVAIVGYDTDWHEELPKVFPHAEGAKANFDNAAEIRHGMGSFNASLQIGYLIIAIRAAGLAAGPMAGYDAEAINKDFFGDGAHKVLAVINIGKPGPDAWFPRSPRLDYDEVVTTV
ncbi:malonic semialdehyde reductase [Actinocorallia sp. A-T 12471]|uniref:malonic semialdehyde reductase n=1 Tax=Actinocorallia sp. A-T 12471 TaxID=3089813 RepID=UPI0029CBB740|nr:malonic semialdehyde reductase [Actinocorallia sp. A-T 12471]MDX6739374.1 malonic semialdehyde reductase [Actinocorallia sp. A-T 12471]